MLCIYEERFIFDPTSALMNRCVFIPFFHLWTVFYQTLHFWNDASCFWLNVACMKICTLIWSKIAFVNKAFVWWASTQLNNGFLFLMDACIYDQMFHLWMNVFPLFCSKDAFRTRCVLINVCTYEIDFWFTRRCIYMFCWSDIAFINRWFLLHPTNLL